MSFAALQSRVNAACAAKLATDEAVLDGIAITGKFDSLSAQGLGGVVLGGNPTFACLAASAGSDPRGKVLVVGGVSYTVREAKPDGTGFVVLELEEQ